MDVIIENENFERLGLIENAELIWATRYYKSGDFELHTTVTDYYLSLINSGLYVVRDDDEDNVGIIEDYEIVSNTEDGDKIKVTGKFAEGYVLNSRVVSQQTILSGNAQYQCRNLIEMNMINATDTNRNISFVKLGAIDNSIDEKIEIQITGANLLDKIEEICESKGIGFRMPLRDDKLYYEMYKGIDRSYAQNENPWVIFSDEYDNLKEVTYVYQTSTLKNIAYVAGEGEGIDRRIVKAYNGIEPKGLKRFELWVDQRNMSTNNGEISEAEIKEQMLEEGLENLTTITTAFDGSVSLSGYTYGKNGDIYIGDIVSIMKTKWNNMYINARIIEVIESYDKNGKQTVLTFGL